MPLAKKMSEMKETLHLTNEEIAVRSGVPVSSVNRITAGKTDNPGWYNMVQMAVGVGFSLDEMAGITEKEEHFTVREKERMLIYRMLSDDSKREVDELMAAEYKKVRGLEEFDEILRESDLLTKLSKLELTKLWALVQYVDKTVNENGRTR